MISRSRASQASIDHFHDYSHYLNKIVNRYEASHYRGQLLRPHSRRPISAMVFRLFRSDCRHCHHDGLHYAFPHSHLRSPLPTASIILTRSPLVCWTLPTTLPTSATRSTRMDQRGLSFTDAAAELTPAFWHNATELFESNDDVFQDYIARMSRGYDVSSCTGTCKKCHLRNPC
jgi:hypothetical protein